MFTIVFEIKINIIFYHEYKLELFLKYVIEVKRVKTTFDIFKSGKNYS